MVLVNYGLNIDIENPKSNFLLWPSFSEAHSAHFKVQIYGLGIISRQVFWGRNNGKGDKT